MFDPFERLSICGSMGVMASPIASQSVRLTHNPMVRKDDGTFTEHF